MNDLTSIIIRTYNSCVFIETALKSIFTQTLDASRYEILVIDDGSSDNIEEALKPYQKNLRFIKQDHKGFLAALNLGIANANGEYLTILDGDDELPPRALQELLDALRQHTDAAFAYGDYYQEDMATKKRILILLQGNVFNSIAAGILWKKRVLEEMNGYDETINFAEYDLLIRALKKYQGIYVPKPVYIYYRHPGSITTNKERNQQAIEQLKKIYGDSKEVNQIRTYE